MLEINRDEFEQGQSIAVLEQRVKQCAKYKSKLILDFNTAKNILRYINSLEVGYLNLKEQLGK